MRNWYYLFVLLVYLTVANLPQVTGYDTPGGPQYHIQTDEGPERYFRYQTLSGQYRKEKRLEDGTVVGTYAWIDDDGILRQRDYIADSAGYRITKSKNLFVGRNIPVGDAVKAAKKVPASAGTLVSSKDRPVPARPIVTVPYDAGLSSTTPKTILSSTFAPNVEISNNALPAITPTPLPFVASTEKPYVEITPHSGGYSSTPVPPLPSSTPGSVQYITPAHTQLPSNVQYLPSPHSGYDGLPTYTEPSQSLDYNPYVDHLKNGYLFHNGPTYPIDRNGHTYRGTKRYSNPRIGNGYDKQFPEYDGVSVTNDGFRYYIPRAYHEEETLPGDEKSGSFGYIDPFGIRRVIYYNAKPGSGFQHRKNNRYVGFNATPYDPRPY